LVLVDPVGIATWAQSTDGQLQRLKRGVALSRRGAILARLGVVRGALGLLASGGRFLPKLVSRASAGQGSSVIERLIGEVRLLPPETAPMVRSHWSNPKCFLGMAAYLECLPKSAVDVVSLVIPRSIPVTVLSAGNATAQELVEREAWVGDSARGKHIRVSDSGHWIQIRRPDVVIDAIRDLVDYHNGMDGNAR
jgi:pimeloyl-ACP methyl ester carboxylesterase